METVLEELFKHLEHEYAFLDAYHEALKAQTNYIIGVNISEIHNTVALFETLGRKHHQLEKTRCELFRRVAGQLNLPPESLTISALVERLEEPWKGRFDELKMRLSTIIHAIAETLETNEFLMSYALDFTHQIISMNDDAIKKDLVYSKNGRKEKRVDSASVLDKRA